MVGARPGDVMMTDVQEVRGNEGGDEGEEEVALDVGGAHPPPGPMSVKARNFKADPMSVNEDGEQDSPPMEAGWGVQQGAFVVNQGHGNVAVTRPKAMKESQVVRHFIMSKPWGMGGKLLDSP